MPEYRGYVNPADVKATPTFDWGTVIKDVQKSLYDSEATRQGNRDKLEKDTNDSITAMGKVTLGKDEALNTKLTEAVYNSKKAVGDYAKLVREGKAAQKDFNLFNQNAMDTFNTIDAVGKNSKAAYDTYVSESKAGNLSAASDYLAQTLGLAASLKDKQIIMDNKGRGFIQGTDPNDLVEVNWLNNERNLLVPKVKLDSLMDANADKIGKYALIGGVTKSGILSIDDAKKRKGYEDYRKTVANGVISDPMGALSILTDYGDIDGVRYTPTINKAEADADKTGTKVYIKLNSTGNPEPVFSPKQLEAAGKIIENEIDQRVDVITTQVENVYRPPVFAPKDSGEPVDVTKNTGPAIPADIIKTIKGKKYKVGSSVGVENVVIDVAKGVTEQIDKFGVYNTPTGKRYYIDYTTYKGKEVTEDGEATITDIVPTKTRLYSDVAGDKFLAKLNLVPNPQTGKAFSNVKEIENYINSNKATSNKGGFDADAYFNQQKGKK